MRIDDTRSSLPLSFPPTPYAPPQPASSPPSLLKLFPPTCRSNTEPGASSAPKGIPLRAGSAAGPRDGGPATLPSCGGRDSRSRLARCSQSAPLPGGPAGLAMHRAIICWLSGSAFRGYHWSARPTARRGARFGRSAEERREKESVLTTEAGRAARVWSWPGLAWPGLAWVGLMAAWEGSPSGRRPLLPPGMESGTQRASATCRLDGAAFASIPGCGKGLARSPDRGEGSEAGKGDQGPWSCVS